MATQRSRRMSSYNYHSNWRKYDFGDLLKLLLPSVSVEAMCLFVVRVLFYLVFFFFFCPYVRGCVGTAV